MQGKEIVFMVEISQEPRNFIAKILCSAHKLDFSLQ